MRSETEADQSTELDFGTGTITEADQSTEPDFGAGTITESEVTNGDETEEQEDEEMRSGLED